MNNFMKFNMGIAGLRRGIKNTQDKNLVFWINNTYIFL